MDRFLSREEMKELMGLLQVPMHCYGNLPMMKINYKKMCKSYHPDKGGDENKMKRLNELWQKLQENVCSARQDTRPPPYGSSTWEQWWHDFNREWDDLFCDETLSSSDEEEQPGGGPSRNSPEHDSRQYPGSSQGSFATPPKPKKQKTFHVPKDFPSELDSFLSNAVYSNKTVCSFLIYTTKEKADFLYGQIDKFKPEFKSKHSFEDAALIFLMTPSKHRVSAIKNFCLTHCTVSFLLCKAVIKPVECYRALCSKPFGLIEENKPGIYEFEFEEEKQPSVDWNKLAEFAELNRLDDPLVIMGFYLDFASEPTNCAKCSKQSLKVHFKYHEKHHRNAVLFKESKAQKNICQQAADVVIAKRRVKVIECTRKELLSERFMLHFERLGDVFSETQIFYYMAGVAWYSCLFEKIDEIVYKILKLLVENVPKKRNVLFRGPINSGKTTLAAAILDLVGGKTLNVNCPAEKLPFELGCAIDQFAVVFEDVKGQIALNKTLQPGQGICNLDNLRDYLDGSVKVNLEKKHVNKKSQIFPPCITTMNDYMLPQTLYARYAYIVNFTPKDHLKKALEANDELMTKRVLQSGITLLLLLVFYLPVSSFSDAVQESVTYWKEIIDKYVGYGKLVDMQGNILQGKDPLTGVLYTSDDEDETQNTETTDSGINTQQTV
ncbi:large T antigen [Rhinolophus simulator polyomavirus 3]|uniref:large T antigen n=1 Tax=Rhinolophus simulator polyomavirus 3 TaxID=2029306 RepID=UPI000B6148CA|nr:large T antigen [Rhinolophus simulator polyomavirus 3]BAZ96598.1 large T antigen [Rhinolophus simulator polyomavirus 3]